MTASQRALYVGLMALSIAAALLLSRGRRSPSPLTNWQRLAIAFGALVGGTFFAKLPYVLSDWDGLVSGSAWLDNGRTLTLGLAGGYLGVEVAKLLVGVKQKTGDALALPLAVSIGIGRLGCFVAGCCYGVPTSLPWACRFADGIPRHPTQLYEAAFHFSAAALLHATRRWEVLRLQRVKAYFLAYFLYRFATEWIRPEPKSWLGLTFYQWACVVLFPVFAALWAIDAHASSARSTSATSSSGSSIPTE